MDDIIEEENKWIMASNKKEKNHVLFFNLYRLTKIHEMINGHFRWVWESDSTSDSYYIEEWEI